MNRSCSMVVALAACMVTVTANAAQQPSASPRGETDVLLKDVGEFTYGGRSYKVRPSVGNGTNASSQWNFAFEPLLQPIRTAAKTGSPVEVAVDGSAVRIQLAIWNIEARRRALETLKAFYGGQADGVPMTNVRVMRVSSLKLTCPDILAVDPSANIQPEQIEFGASTGGIPESVPVVIKAGSPQLARDIGSIIPSSQWTVETSFFARIALDARVKLEGARELMSEFRASLDGTGTKPDSSGNVFVHRSDLRKFLTSQREFIVANAVVEKGALASPEDFVGRVIATFMSRWDALAARDLAAMDAASKQSTYNAQDLAPTEVTKTLSHVIEKGSGEDQFKVNVKGSAGGGISLGPISVNANAQGEYSKEEVAKWLRENDVTAEWNGQRWEAKAVLVRQVNDSALSSLSSAVVAYSQVLPAEATTDRATVFFSAGTADGVESLGGRVTALEEASNGMIGLIVPYAGSAATIPDGWILADGRVLTDPKYARLAALVGSTFSSDGVPRAPDLRGRTAVGAGEGSGLKARGLGTYFGTEGGTLPAHTHQAPSHWHLWLLGGGGANLVTGGGFETAFMSGDTGAIGGLNAPSHSAKGSGGLRTDSRGDEETSQANNVTVPPDNNMQPATVVTYLIRYR